MAAGIGLNILDPWGVRDPDYALRLRAGINLPQAVMLGCLW